MTKEQFQELLKTFGCCFLAICCPPASPKHRAAFRALCTGHGMTEAQADSTYESYLAAKEVG